jgi:subtilisin family serine protease
VSGRVGNAAGLPTPALAKWSPRLLEAVRATPDDSVTAWIEFADKGETSPGDLARRLTMAEAALSPRTRARRLRAHVHPLVDYADLPVNPDYVAGLVARGFAPCGASRWLNQVAVRVPAARLSAAAELPFVARLEPVERVLRSPDPPATSPLPVRAPATAHSAAKIMYGYTQSQMSQVGIPDLHKAGYTGTGVLICVLDDGFNYFTKHEALRDQVIPPERQRDFLRGLNTVQDTLVLDPRDAGMQHGTWCLGVMAGRKFGTYVGAAFDAQYALGRTEVDAFERTQEMIYWGMGAEWADSLGADIISSSLGYSTFDSTAYNYSYSAMDGHTTVISRAAQIAAQKGIIVVSAAGNEGNQAWHYITAPADVNGDSLIAAGAVDLNGTPASFSSYGPSADGRVKPDLAACGVSYPLVSGSSDPNAYTSQNGTSFATPTLAGLAACVIQARPQWTPREVILALRSSASRHLTPDNRVGYGIPNGLLALDSTTGVPGGPPTRLTLRLVGSNPVVLSHGPASFVLALSVEMTGRSATLRVFDSQGRRVRELWSGVVTYPALLPPISWDGRDDDGRAVASGLYIVDLRAGDEHVALRLAALR